MNELNDSEDLGKVNRRSALHVQALRMNIANAPHLPYAKNNEKIDSRFSGAGYYENTCMCWNYGSNPVFFPRWKKLKGFQK